MTADLSRLDGRLKRWKVTLRDGYEKRFVELVADLPLPAGDRPHPVAPAASRAPSTGRPTWYRPGAKTPADIARALVAALR